MSQQNIKKVIKTESWNFIQASSVFTAYWYRKNIKPKITTSFNNAISCFFGRNSIQKLFQTSFEFTKFELWAFYQFSRWEFVFFGDSNFRITRSTFPIDLRKLAELILRRFLDMPLRHFTIFQSILCRLYYIVYILLSEKLTNQRLQNREAILIGLFLKQKLTL